MNIHFLKYAGEDLRIKGVEGSRKMMEYYNSQNHERFKFFIK